jgi:hypothetical protein
MSSIELLTESGVSATHLTNQLRLHLVLYFHLFQLTDQVVFASAVAEALIYSILAFSNFIFKICDSDILHLNFSLQSFYSFCGLSFFFHSPLHPYF